MQRAGNGSGATSAHRQVKASTTLNRKYVKRPEASRAENISIKRSPRLSHFNTPSITPTKVAEPETLAAVTHPLQESAREKMRTRQQDATAAQTPKLTAREIKEQAIRKAMLQAAKTEEVDEISAKKAKKVGRLHFGFAHVALALACAAAVVFAIVYFVNLNMPDISLKVAAMQSGIDASYPTYVPRDYSLSSITSENGKIVLEFNNGSTGDSFNITEEQSHWDSSALLSNFVKDEYGENYTTIREQGLTIYVSNSDAAWVNGGVVYKIKTTSGSLTKKQIRSIAVSL